MKTGYLEYKNIVKGNIKEIFESIFSMPLIEMISDYYCVPYRQLIALYLYKKHKKFLNQLRIERKEDNEVDEFNYSLIQYCQAILQAIIEKKSVDFSSLKVPKKLLSSDNYLKPLNALAELMETKIIPKQYEGQMKINFSFQVVMNSQWKYILDANVADMNDIYIGLMTLLGYRQVIIDQYCYEIMRHSKKNALMRKNTATNGLDYSQWLYLIAKDSKFTTDIPHLKTGEFALYRNKAIYICFFKPKDLSGLQRNLSQAVHEFLNYAFVSLYQYREFRAKNPGRNATLTAAKTAAIEHLQIIIEKIMLDSKIELCHLNNFFDQLDIYQKQTKPKLYEPKSKFAEAIDAIISYAEMNGFHRGEGMKFSQIDASSELPFKENIQAFYNGGT